MNTNSFKSRLKKFPINKKLIGIGSVLILVSVFLPWYKDFDKYNYSETFLGVTGPLYLTGLIILMVSSLSCLIILFDFFQKPLPDMPIKKDHFHLFTAGLTIFMLILTNSVYFHIKFGVNLMDKQIGTGMIICFVGLVIFLLGTVLNLRKSELKSDVMQNHLRQLQELTTSTYQDRKGSIKEREPELPEPIEQVANNVENSIKQRIPIKEVVNRSNNMVEDDLTPYSGTGSIFQETNSGDKNYFGGANAYRNENLPVINRTKTDPVNNQPLTIQDKINEYNSLNNGG